MKGYKVDFTASTITITADFAKKMDKALDDIFQDWK